MQRLCAKRYSVVMPSSVESRKLNRRLQRAEVDFRDPKKTLARTVCMALGVSRSTLPRRQRGPIAPLQLWRFSQAWPDRRPINQPAPARHPRGVSEGHTLHGRWGDLKKRKFLYAKAPGGGGLRRLTLRRLAISLLLNHSWWSLRACGPCRRSTGRLRVPHEAAPPGAPVRSRP
jgi:hypothetical protein